MLASHYPASEEGLVTHVALLREGRVALLASLKELEAGEQRLSMDGIAAVADAKAAGRGSPRGTRARPSGR